MKEREIYLVKETLEALIISFISSFFWIAVLNVPTSFFLPYLGMGVIGVMIAKYIVKRQNQDNEDI